MAWGSVTFIGSGEFSPLMGKTYRKLVSVAGARVRGAVLDTPAGFEVNAAQIAAKAVTYFRERVNLQSEVVQAASLETLTPEVLEAAQGRLRRAALIFAGAGSPTYAARVWRETPLGAALQARVAEGAHVIFASAAALAAGTAVIPVYEIYKAGHGLAWAEGVDILAAWGVKLAVVPHWNNREGGDYDTSRCFMGAARFAALEAGLPADVVVLGIDEYSACTLWLARGEIEVAGAGGVTVRCAGREQTYASGATFPLDVLRAEGAAVALPPVPEVVPMVDEPAAAPAVAAQDVAQWVEVLIGLRRRLRAEKLWQLADEVRQALSAAGVELRDGPQGTEWGWKEHQA